MDQIERRITKFAAIFRDRELRPVKKDPYVDNLLATRTVRLFDFMGKHEGAGGFKKDDKRRFVYLFYGRVGEDLDVIYVGKSNHVRERVNKHKISSPFWPQVMGIQYVEVTRDEIDEVEQAVIDALAPPCNRQSNPNYDRAKGEWVDEGD